MTTPTPEIEATLHDLSTNLHDLSTNLHDLSAKFDKLASENEKFNDKFDNYQKATQWVVQLAFTLIASATITVIISTVIRNK
jgi:predicted nuclease with TOPRIM domain